jgi:hypothetical protein
MIAATYLHILRKIYPLLSSCTQPWVITGSFGMALQGMDVEVHDIDLQTNQAGAYEIERLFSNDVKEPVRFSTSDAIRSHFGALEIDGVKVEIMGDLQKRLTPEPPVWEEPVKVEDHRCWVDVEEMRIPVLSLEYEYQAYLKLGRTEKAAQIKRWLEKDQPQPSPFISIWFHPRATIRRIVDSDPTKHVILLAILMGIEEALNLASSQQIGKTWSLVAILAVCMIAGALFGVLFLYANAEIYRWLGSLGNATLATSKQVRAAVAWAYIPNISLLLLWGLDLLNSGEKLFKGAVPISKYDPLDGIVGFWSLIILLSTLSEIQRSSKWESCAVMLLSIFVVIIPIVLLSQLTGLWIAYILLMAIPALIAVLRRD